jgi:hypothetical protein
MRFEIEISGDDSPDRQSALQSLAECLIDAGQWIKDKGTEPETNNHNGLKQAGNPDGI